MPQYSDYEWTYLMLISKLLKDVGEDKTIPTKTKFKILKRIDHVQQLLEPFST